MAIRIQFRRDTAANWTLINPLLAEGEIGNETDTGKFKVGNGTTLWNSLPYSSGPAGPTGPTGATGATGATGDAGPGVATGGTAGQILAKIDATNYNTEWIDNYTSQVKHQVKASEAITKGQAVYVSNANGTNMIVSKASNSAESTSSKTMGLVVQTMATNDIGYVITEGLLSGLNTFTATIGDPVWLGTSGNLLYGLSNKPYAPSHLVFIGIVTRVHAVNGEIFVKIQNGFELDELHNVDLKTVAPTNGQTIVWDSATSLFKPGDAMPSRTTATVTTTSIASKANFTGTITMAKGYRLLNIQTDYPARVRLYSTTAGQTADLTRSSDVDALDTNGLAFEYITGIDPYTSVNYMNVDVPSIDGHINSGSAVPITVTNNDTVSRTITVTLTYIKTEV